MKSVFFASFIAFSGSLAILALSKIATFWNEKFPSEDGWRDAVYRR